MTLPLVRQALETALAAMSPALATAYENVPFDATADTPFQRAYLLPAEPFNPEIGGLVREQGVFHITLFYPLSTGPAAASTRAELIRDIFYRGASFTAGGVVTQIEKTPEIGAGAASDDRWILPVRIRYFAHYH
jgi:hypothetical protein